LSSTPTIHHHVLVTLDQDIDGCAIHLHRDPGILVPS